MLRIILFTFVFNHFLFAENYLYLAGKDGLAIYSSNNNGHLMKLNQFKLGQTKFILSSHDKRFLYVSAKSDKKSKLITFEIVNKEKPVLLHNADFPNGCVYMALSNDKKTLFSTNYKEGALYGFQIKDGIYKGNHLFKENIDNTAHCVTVYKNNVYTAHTKPNKIYQFCYESGELKKLDQPYVNGPESDTLNNPRHFAKSAKYNVIYTSNEKVGAVSSWKVNQQGELKLWQTFSTLKNKPTWHNAASDIQISPDGRHLVVINRDVAKKIDPETKLNDSLAVFELDCENGAIHKRTHVYPTESMCRSLSISPCGKYVYTAGGGNSKLAVYSLSPQGELKLIQRLDCMDKPAWLLSL